MGFPERWHGLRLCHGARGPGGWAVCGGRGVAADLSFCLLSKIHGCFSSLKCTRSSSISFQCINSFQCMNSYSEAAAEAQQHLNPHPQWSSSVRPHAGLCFTKHSVTHTNQSRPIQHTLPTAGTPKPGTELSPRTVMSVPTEVTTAGSTDQMTFSKLCARGRGRQKHPNKAKAT